MDFNQIAINMKNIINEQAAITIILKGYFESALEQADIDFSFNERLIKYQNKINHTMRIIKSYIHNYYSLIDKDIKATIIQANTYPKAIKYIVEHYHHTDLSKSEYLLPELGAIVKLAKKYKSHVYNIIFKLNPIMTDLAIEDSRLQMMMYELNVLTMQQDNNLEVHKNSLMKIEQEIANEEIKNMRQTVNSFHGTLSIFLGALAHIPLANSTINLMMGGCMGIYDENGQAAVSYRALVSMLQAKIDLIAKNKTFSAEMKLAQGILIGLIAINHRMVFLRTSLIDLQHVWERLITDTSQLIEDYKADRVTTEFINACLNKDIHEIDNISDALSDTQAKISSVKIIKATPTQTLFDILPQHISR